MYKETHEEVPNLPAKTVLTVMGDHLYGSSVHDIIDVAQFNYDGVHTLGTECYDDMLMNISKTGTKKRMKNSIICFRMRKGL